MCTTNYIFNTYIMCYLSIKYNNITRPIVNKYFKIIYDVQLSC